MAASRKRRPRRQRVGQVSYYFHHGAWHIYYRDGQRQVRRRVADDEKTAAQVAAQVNAQLAASAPSLFSYTPITVGELRGRFLDHHEHVLRSSLATVNRYRAATQHLENFADARGPRQLAHRIQADQFVRYLRSIRVPPNGHANAARRSLRDKGIRFVLETCRAMYGYAAKKRHLPPYADNPFAELGGKRFKIEDAKAVFVFDETTEAAFFAAADPWTFPLHFTLAKTGIRPGELVHLLIEELDLDKGWLYIRGKPSLGWRIKTGRDRPIPLVDELVAVLRRVIGSRTAGLVFLRQRFSWHDEAVALLHQQALATIYEQRLDAEVSRRCQSLNRTEQAHIAKAVWRDAGIVKTDAIRLSFMRIMRTLGLPQATCPKSWRHTFATLLQDAAVDPLIRQLTLGHQPAEQAAGALGMTSVYTHTRPETHRAQITRAVCLWPKSLQLAQNWVQGGA